MENKEETDERIQEMLKDTSDDQATFFELQVHKSRVRVTKKVIESSQVWLDTIDSTDPEDDSPILIPSFITKQMILDLVEMVEKDDMECAHLVLVSLSYLLDFLVALDFLCCDKLKAGVEERIKERITETNWREVLTFTKDIMGLDNTTRAALEPILKPVNKYYLEHKLDMDKEHEDLWSREYCSLSAPVFKLGLRSKLISEETKIHMLRNWVASNYFLLHQDAVFEMLQCLDLKKLLGSIHEVTSMVKSWPLTDEQVTTFDTMVSRARQVIEKEESEDKRKCEMLGRIVFLQRFRDRDLPLSRLKVSWLLQDVQATAHLMMDPKPGSVYEKLEKMFEARAGGMEMEADLVRWFVKIVKSS